MTSYNFHYENIYNSDEFKEMIEYYNETLTPLSDKDPIIEFKINNCDLIHIDDKIFIMSDLLPGFNLYVDQIYKYQLDLIKNNEYRYSFIFDLDVTKEELSVHKYEYITTYKTIKVMVFLDKYAIRNNAWFNPTHYLKFKIYDDLSYTINFLKFER